jgi:hypothetical protein
MNDEADVPVNRILPTAVKLASVLTPAQVTVRSPAMFIAPAELVNAPAAPQFRVRERPAVAFVTAVDTVMFPELSIEMFLAVIADTKSDAKMFVADAAFAWKTPSINCPAVVPELVTVIEVATNVGVTESEVPTNASAVTVKVWAEPPSPDWKPIFEKVATPSREVVVVDVMFVVTPPIVCCSTDPLAAVRVTCALAPE